MKHPVFLFVIFLSLRPMYANAQYSSVEAMDKIDAALNKINSGKYEAELHIKRLTSTDTVLSEGIVYFEKQADSIYPFRFRIETPKKQIIFDGEKIILFSYFDSTVYVDEDVKQNETENSLLFKPFLYQNYFRERILSQSIDSIQFDSSLHTARLAVFFKDDTSSDFRRHSQVYHLNQASWIPQKINLQISMFEMNQHSVLKVKYLDSVNNISIPKFNIETIPSTFKIYYTHELKNLRSKLTESGIFPAWSLLSVAGDTVSSDELKSKLKLYDFWYMSCYPCIKAMPALEALHKKYSSRGLIVIGMNPYDSDNAALAKFLNNRSITYPNFIVPQSFTGSLNVTVFPSYFLIDKNNQIIFSGEGYREDIESFFEEKIIQYLSK